MEKFGYNWHYLNESCEYSLYVVYHLTIESFEEGSQQNGPDETSQAKEAE